jgi:acyl carrier protein
MKLSPQSNEELVRAVIARHMQVDPTTLTRSSHLQRDLELDPLDLVLIALRIEDIKGRDFPIAQLEWAHTVADLTRIVKSLDGKSSGEHEFTLDILQKRAAGAR